MCKHSIILKRDRMGGFLSSQSIGTDALNALRSIPGVEDLEVVSESNDLVELNYFWGGDSNFWQTTEYLVRYGLARADVE